MKVFTPLTTTALVIIGLTLSAAADDATWLKSGTQIFEDSFDREEDGNLAAAIGNGWNSATANRVPDIKQADLDGGQHPADAGACGAAGHQHSFGSTML
jgi:hypothetical protein